MSHNTPIYNALDDWIRAEAIPFSVASSEGLNSAVDEVIDSLGDSVELLGFGEALHGGEDILVLRNRLFQRLVESHGFSAIALESSFPKARIVNNYIAGREPTSYAAVQETGFSHGFGRLEANRELVEWMRAYNADASHQNKLQFHGFDSPTEMTGSDSPRQILRVVLNYLKAVDGSNAKERRERIDAFIGQDAAWENPAAMMDPAQSVGLSPEAKALRLETEDLMMELQIRRPELSANGGKNHYREALHYTSMARQFLSYHAAVARESEDRFDRLLGLRDAMMANHLAYLVSHERGRGKVFAFAHNSHLKRGKAEWQLGEELHTWWPAGAHLQEILGPSYAIIGSALWPVRSQRHQCP